MAEIKRLINSVEIKVRFSEVDSMGVVWHGNYVKFIEDGRESFGDQYQLGYNDVFQNGFMTPIVKLDVNFKQMVRYGEKIIVETEFIRTEAAKIIFNYKLYNAVNNNVVLTATSTQVFTDLKGELQLTNPEFYTEWQKKMGIVN